MTAIAYPSSLPGPTAAPIQSAERRNVSPLDGPRTTAVGQRDRLATQQVAFVFTFAEAAIFRAWWKDTLVYGGAWFAAIWPLPQGMVTGVRKFLGTPKWSEYLPNVGWRITAVCEVRGRGELPVVVVPDLPFAIGISQGVGGASGGGGDAPALPPGVQPGDGMVMCVIHRVDATFTIDNPTAWPLGAATLDSSSTLRFRFFCRVADGTADDNDCGFSVDIDSAAWALISFSSVSDAHFPDVLVGGANDYNFGLEAGGVNPGSTTKGASGSQISILAAFICNTSPATAALTGPPAGYTAAADQSVTYTMSGNTVNAQLVLAYRTLVGASENPAAFSDNGGSFGSGGEGALSLLLTYTP